MEIRDDGLVCEVFWGEKSVNQVPMGLQESFTFPEHEWADVSVDFIMRLPIFNEGHDAILMVVDRATVIVHVVH